MKRFISWIKGGNVDPVVPEQKAGEPTENLFRRAVGDALIRDLISERQTERRWRMFRRTVFSGLGVVFFGVYVYFYMTSQGFKLMPNSEVAGIVRIEGPISSDSVASADNIIPVLSKAFTAGNVKSIVLLIDSPGGSPSESERINEYIEYQRKKTGKPIYAVITNVGASAAYMIAIHADKVYAGRYSLVGSIGAIMTGWDFHKVADKLQVSQRVFASGEMKHMMDPYSPMKPEAMAKAQDIVTSMGATFANEVKRQRKNKLAKDVDLFTGEVWPGEQALSLGLIDGIATVDGIVKQTWNIPHHDMGPDKPKKNFFSNPLGYFSGMVAESVAETVFNQPYVPAVR